MNINQKITLKGVTSNVITLIKSNYQTVVVDKNSVNSLPVA